MRNGMQSPKKHLWDYTTEKCNNEKTVENYIQVEIKKKKWS